MDNKITPKKTATKYKIVVEWTRVTLLIKILTVITTIVGCIVAICHYSSVLRGVTADAGDTVTFGLQILFTLLAFEYHCMFRKMRELDDYLCGLSMMLSIFFFFGSGVSTIISRSRNIKSINNSCETCLGKYAHEPVVQTYVTTFWISESVISGIYALIICSLVYKPIYRYFRSIVQIVPVEYEV